MVNVNYSESIGKSDHTTLGFEWRKSYRVLHPSLPRRNTWRADLDSMSSEAAKIDWNFAPDEELEHMCPDTFQYLGSQHHVTVHLGLILNFERYGKDANGCGIGLNIKLIPHIMKYTKHVGTNVLSWNVSRDQNMKKDWLNQPFLPPNDCSAT